MQKRKLKVVYIKDGVYIGNQEVGTKNMALNYKGEIIFLRFIFKKFQINHKNVLEKYEIYNENKEEIKNDFLKFNSLDSEIENIFGKRLFKGLDISFDVFEKYSY